MLVHAVVPAPLFKIISPTVIVLLLWRRGNAIRATCRYCRPRLREARCIFIANARIILLSQNSRPEKRIPYFR